MKIKIKSTQGKVLFSHDEENNTVRRTLEKANLEDAKVSANNEWVKQSSQQMLYIFSHLKSELPYLREKLISGKVDGTHYEGQCACLIGSLANSKKKNTDELCNAIPYYSLGLHNVAEQWFFQIRVGDTPENSFFAKHALKLIDDVLKGSQSHDSGMLK